MAQKNEGRGRGRGVGTKLPGVLEDVARSPGASAVAGSASLSPAPQPYRPLEQESQSVGGAAAATNVADGHPLQPEPNSSEAQLVESLKKTIDKLRYKIDQNAAVEWTDSEKRYDAFISFHGSESLLETDADGSARNVRNDIAKPLYKYLTESLNLSVFFDDANIKPSENLYIKILQAMLSLRGGGTAIILVTAHSLTEPWPFFELFTLLKLFQNYHPTGLPQDNSLIYRLFIVYLSPERLTRPLLSHIFPPNTRLFKYTETLPEYDSSADLVEDLRQRLDAHFRLDNLHQIYGSDIHVCERYLKFAIGSWLGNKLLSDRSRMQDALGALAVLLGADQSNSRSFYDLVDLWYKNEIVKMHDDPQKIFSEITRKLKALVSQQFIDQSDMNQIINCVEAFNWKWFGKWKNDARTRHLNKQIFETMGELSTALQRLDTETGLIEPHTMTTVAVKRSEQRSSWLTTAQLALSSLWWVFPTDVLGDEMVTDEFERVVLVANIVLDPLSPWTWEFEISKSLRPAKDVLTKVALLFAALDVKTVSTVQLYSISADPLEKILVSSSCDECSIKNISEQSLDELATLSEILLSTTSNKEVNPPYKWIYYCLSCGCYQRVSANNPEYCRLGHPKDLNNINDVYIHDELREQMRSLVDRLTTATTDISNDSSSSPLNYNILVASVSQLSERISHLPSWHACHPVTQKKISYFKRTIAAIEKFVVEHSKAENRKPEFRKQFSNFVGILSQIAFNVDDSELGNRLAMAHSKIEGLAQKVSAAASMTYDDTATQRESPIGEQEYDRSSEPNRETALPTPPAMPSSAKLTWQTQSDIQPDGSQEKSGIARGGGVADFTKSRLQLRKMDGLAQAELTKAEVFEKINAHLQGPNTKNLVDSIGRLCFPEDDALNGTLQRLKQNTSREFTEMLHELDQLYSNGLSKFYVAVSKRCPGAPLTAVVATMRAYPQYFPFVSTDPELHEWHFPDIDGENLHLTDHVLDADYVNKLTELKERLDVLATRKRPEHPSEVFVICCDEDTISAARREVLEMLNARRPDTGTVNRSAFQRGWHLDFSTIASLKRDVRNTLVLSKSALSADAFSWVTHLGDGGWVLFLDNVNSEDEVRKATLFKKWQILGKGGFVLILSTISESHWTGANTVLALNEWYGKIKTFNFALPPEILSIKEYASFLYSFSFKGHAQHRDSKRYEIVAEMADGSFISASISNPRFANDGRGLNVEGPFSFLVDFEGCYGNKVNVKVSYFKKIIGERSITFSPPSLRTDMSPIFCNTTETSTVLRLFFKGFPTLRPVTCGAVNVCVHSQAADQSVVIQEKCRPVVTPLSDQDLASGNGLNLTFTADQIQQVQMQWRIFISMQSLSISLYVPLFPLIIRQLVDLTIPKVFYNPVAPLEGSAMKFKERELSDRRTAVTKESMRKFSSIVSMQTQIAKIAKMATFGDLSHYGSTLADLLEKALDTVFEGGGRSPSSSISPPVGLISGSIHENIVLIGQAGCGKTVYGRLEMKSASESIRKKCLDILLSQKCDSSSFESHRIGLFLDLSMFSDKRPSAIQRIKILIKSNADMWDTCVLKQFELLRKTCWIKAMRSMLESHSNLFYVCLDGLSGVFDASKLISYLSELSNIKLLITTRPVESNLKFFKSQSASRFAMRSLKPFTSEMGRSLILELLPESPQSAADTQQFLAHLDRLWPKWYSLPTNVPLLAFLKLRDNVDFKNITSTYAVFQCLLNSLIPNKRLSQALKLFFYNEYLEVQAESAAANCSFSLDKLKRFLLQTLADLADEVTNFVQAKGNNIFFQIDDVADAYELRSEIFLDFLVGSHICEFSDGPEFLFRCFVSRMRQPSWTNALQFAISGIVSKELSNLPSGESLDEDTSVDSDLLHECILKVYEALKLSTDYVKLRTSEEKIVCEAVFFVVIAEGFPQFQPRSFAAQLVCDSVFKTIDTVSEELLKDVAGGYSGFRLLSAEGVSVESSDSVALDIDDNKSSSNEPPPVSKQDLLSFFVRKMTSMNGGRMFARSMMFCLSILGQEVRHNADAILNNFIMSVLSSRDHPPPHGKARRHNRLSFAGNIDANKFLIEKILTELFDCVRNKSPALLVHAHRMLANRVGNQRGELILTLIQSLQQLQIFCIDATQVASTENFVEVLVELWSLFLGSLEAVLNDSDDYRVIETSSDVINWIIHQLSIKLYKDMKLTLVQWISSYVSLPVNEARFSISPIAGVFQLTGHDKLLNNVDWLAYVGKLAVENVEHELPHCSVIACTLQFVERYGSLLPEKLQLATALVQKSDTCLGVFDLAKSIVAPLLQSFESVSAFVQKLWASCQDIVSFRCLTWLHSVGSTFELFRDGTFLAALVKKWFRCNPDGVLSLLSTLPQAQDPAPDGENSWIEDQNIITLLQSLSTLLKSDSSLACYPLFRVVLRLFSPLMRFSVAIVLLHRLLDLDLHRVNTPDRLLWNTIEGWPEKMRRSQYGFQVVRDCLYATPKIDQMVRLSIDIHSSWEVVKLNLLRLTLFPDSDIELSTEELVAILHLVSIGTATSEAEVFDSLFTTSTNLGFVPRNFINVSKSILLAQIACSATKSRLMKDVLLTSFTLMERVNIRGPKKSIVSSNLSLAKSESVLVLAAMALHASRGFDSNRHEKRDKNTLLNSFLQVNQETAHADHVHQGFAYKEFRMSFTPFENSNTVFQRLGSSSLNSDDAGKFLEDSDRPDLILVECLSCLLEAQAEQFSLQRIPKVMLRNILSIFSVADRCERLKRYWKPDNRSMKGAVSVTEFLEQVFLEIGILQPLTLMNMCEDLMIDNLQVTPSNLWIYNALQQVLTNSMHGSMFSETQKLVASQVSKQLRHLHFTSTSFAFVFKDLLDDFQSAMSLAKELLPENASESLLLARKIPWLALSYAIIGESSPKKLSKHEIFLNTIAFKCLPGTTFSSSQLSPAITELLFLWKPPSTYDLTNFSGPSLRIFVNLVLSAVLQKKNFEFESRWALALLPYLESIEVVRIGFETFRVRSQHGNNSNAYKPVWSLSASDRFDYQLEVKPFQNADKSLTLSNYLSKLSKCEQSVLNFATVLSLRHVLLCMQEDKTFRSEVVHKESPINKSLMASMLLSPTLDKWLLKNWLSQASMQDCFIGLMKQLDNYNQLRLLSKDYGTVSGSSDDILKCATMASERHDVDALLLLSRVLVRRQLLVGGSWSELNSAAVANLAADAYDKFLIAGAETLWKRTSIIYHGAIWELGAHQKNLERMADKLIAEDGLGNIVWGIIRWRMTLIFKQGGQLKQQQEILSWFSNWLQRLTTFESTDRPDLFLLQSLLKKVPLIQPHVANQGTAPHIQIPSEPSSSLQSQTSSSSNAASVSGPDTPGSILDSPQVSDAFDKIVYVREFLNERPKDDTGAEHPDLLTSRLKMEIKWVAINSIAVDIGVIPASAGTE